MVTCLASSKYPKLRIIFLYDMHESTDIFENHAALDEDRWMLVGTSEVE